MNTGAKPRLDLSAKPEHEAVLGPALSPPWRKILLMGLGVALLLAVVYLSPLRGYLGRLREMTDHIRAWGPLAPLAVTAGVALLVAIGFSRLFLCGIAGMALGFWSGLLWVQLGSLAGNYLTFLVVRFGARDWARRYLAKHGKLNTWLKADGILGVILARQVPVPGLLVNLACGLFPLRHRHFLIGTFIGQLPEAVPCTLIGAGLLHLSPTKSAEAIGLAVAIAILLWFGLRWLIRRQKAVN